MVQQTHLEYNNRVQVNLTLIDRLYNIPWGLFLVAAMLGGIGVTILFSVAPGESEKFGGWVWALPHMKRLALILPLGIMIAVLDIRVWHRWAYQIYGVSVFLLVLVKFLGTESNSSVRWIDLGFMQLQPSEIVQVGLILALSRYFHGRTLEETRSLPWLIVPMLLIAVPFSLIVSQPDLGTSLKLIMIALAVAFMAGVRLWLYIVAIFAVSIFFVSVWSIIGFDRLMEWGILKSYQAARIQTMFDCVDLQGACYQIYNSLIAIGNGGFLGQGYGQGSQIQNDFLPEAQTDFILAAIGEEFGLLGVLSFFAVQMLLVIMAFTIALRSQSQFGRLLGSGLMMNIFLYFFINASMVAGLLPVVGVPLPLVSYGGTAMLVAVGMVGLLGSIHIHRHVPIERRVNSRDVFS